MQSKITLEGRRAFNDGSKRSSNPYPVSDESWTFWMEGFDQAQVEAETPHPEARPARLVVLDRDTN